MAKTLDKKMTVSMMLQAWGGKLQQLLASSLNDEEKLEQIIAQLERDVQQKRVLARQTGAQMRAIADPDTKQFEPLEALQSRREKLVKLGGKLVDDPDKAAQLGQVSQEIKALEGQIAAQEKTYETLQQAYELARDNYRQALSALETVKSNGPAMLKAIAAHKQAIAMRDQAAKSEGVDTSFLADLEGELNSVQAELRSDETLDDDLDATSGYNVDAELAKLDAETVSDDLMAEFRAASGKAPVAAGA